MNHLMEISQLTKHQVEVLIQRALFFKSNLTYPDYSQYTLANLFYENSTRTRVSFELAAKKMAMPVVNLDLQNSSETKGEHIEDTVKTLMAMGISLFVIRHRQEWLPQAMADLCNNNQHIVNAGDGKHAHPSQALLDVMTIIEKKPNLRELKVAIVGNIRHSRVANSLQCIFLLLGVRELILVAPEIWHPQSLLHGRITTSLPKGLADADVVICLRVQHERLSENEYFDLDMYRRHYAITQKTLAYAKKDAMVMHPGPINRGIEIDSDIADGPQSVILQQVANGVFMRMAILESCVINGANEIN